MRFAVSLLAASLALAVPAWGREAPAAAVQTADRFVVLDGGRNFRDLGGYRTADGHVVRRGLLYRSGSLGKLAPAGQQRLAQLHVARIVDLRTTTERASDTFDLKAAYGAGYWTRDYDHPRGDKARAAPDMARATPESMKAMMLGAYRTLPRDQAPAYRQLFAELQTAAPGPTVVNCTAGKDRTGVAAALVLTALGVPYETVRQDFLLTNGAPGMDTLQANLSPMMRDLPADVVAPVIGVDGAYIDTAFAQIRQDYGSVEGYLDKELGVGPRAIARLRARMLTR